MSKLGERLIKAAQEGRSIVRNEYEPRFGDGREEDWFAWLCKEKEEEASKHITKVCKRCGMEKSIDEFHKAKAKGLKSPLSRQANCKKCQHALLKLKRQDPAQKQKFKHYRWRSSLKERYGITEQEYLAILSNQDGGCAICGAKATKRRLHVDHCHETERIRGIICNNCNNGLGRFKDNPGLLREAAFYLEKA